MSKSNLTVVEGMCIIAGYGIGSGVMLLPYFVSKNGIFTSLFIISIAFIISALLHLMIAELSFCSENSQIISIFNTFLFKGKFKNLLTWTFFILMLITLLSNLAIYISGSSLIISSILPVSDLGAKLIFYLFAAGVVFFGLKAIGISEKLSILVIFITLVILAAATLFIDIAGLPTAYFKPKESLVLFGKIMFVLVAFFSVPQVVNGLKSDKKKIRQAILGGMGINLIISLIIVVFSLLAFEIPTGMKASEYMAIIRWTEPIGTWAKLLGSLITLMAFLTTYWSISLALSDMVKEQTNASHIIAWLIATVPSLLITLILPVGFDAYIDYAGGAIAILIVLLLIPAFRNMIKTHGGNGILGKYTGLPVQVAVVIGYLLMTVGSLI